MLSRGTSAYFSYPDFQALQAHGRLLSGLTASFPIESDLEVAGVSEFVAAEAVSANYGSVVGVVPALRRWFTSETEPIAVIRYAAWQYSVSGTAAADRGRTNTWNPKSWWPAPRQPERIAAHDRRRRRSAHRVRERRQPLARARVPAPARTGHTTGTRRHEISPDTSAADGKPRAGYRRRRKRHRAGRLDDQNPRTSHALCAIDLPHRAGFVTRRARHRVRDDPLARDNTCLRAGTCVARIAEQRSRSVQRGNWRLNQASASLRACHPGRALVRVALDRRQRDRDAASAASH